MTKSIQEILQEIVDALKGIEKKLDDLIATMKANPRTAHNYYYPGNAAAANPIYYPQYYPYQVWP